MRHRGDVVPGLLVAALVLVVITGRPGGGAVAGVLALATALALGAALRRRGETTWRRRRGELVLAVLFLATLVQLHAGGGRLGGDGVSYFVYVRSLVKDADLDFTNEYTHYGLIERDDIRVPTRTGLRRSIFAIGPGLVWIPFFLLGEGVARAESVLGLPADLSGYGPAHVNAIALGSAVCGFVAVLLVHDLLRRHFRDSTALLAALLVWGATFLHWYMVHQPAMSHAPSAMGAAFVVWLWDRGRGSRSLVGWAGLGLACGLAMCLRWQNGALLLLPAWDLALALGRAGRAAIAPLVARGAVLAAAALIGALPQLAAWKAIYGEWILRYPPHGADFVRLDHPFVLSTLFSSRHGLFSWTPVFWLGYLGLVPLFARRRPLALAVLPPLLVMTYVNMCSGDWWAGGSFSNRRFDSLLALLALSLAAFLDALARGVARRPAMALFAVVAPLVVWHGAVSAAVRHGAVVPEKPVAFPAVVGAAWRATATTVGSPNTWPASWVFAMRHARPPGQYDRAVGLYLFYRQNNLGGRVRLGGPEGEALAAEGWGAIVAGDDDRRRRVLRGRARLLAPLDVAEELLVRVVTAPALEPTVVGLDVNGRPLARSAMPAGATEVVFLVPAPTWRRELNDVVLTTDRALLVEELVFERPAAAGPVKWERER